MKLFLAPLLLATQSSPFKPATPEEAGFEPEALATLVGELERDPTSGYGYPWWVTEHREGETAIFAARDFGGQFLVASPETETLAVFLGWDMPAPTHELLRSRVLPALE